MLDGEVLMEANSAKTDGESSQDFVGEPEPDLLLSGPSLSVLLDFLCSSSRQVFLEECFIGLSSGPRRESMCSSVISELPE